MGALTRPQHMMLCDTGIPKRPLQLNRVTPPGVMPFHFGHSPQDWFSPILYELDKDVELVVALQVSDFGKTASTDIYSTKVSLGEDESNQQHTCDLDKCPLLARLGPINDISDIIMLFDE